MKRALEEEVDMQNVALETMKNELEVWYSRRYADKDIVDDVKDRYEELMQKADSHLRDYATCARSVRSQVATGIEVCWPRSPRPPSHRRKRSSARVTRSRMRLVRTRL